MSDARNALYYGDNLDVLRRYVPDTSVDLVYLDPPFNSNQDYNVLFKRRGSTCLPGTNLGRSGPPPVRVRRVRGRANFSARRAGSNWQFPWRGGKRSREECRHSGRGDRGLDAAVLPIWASGVRGNVVDDIMLR